MGDSLFDIFGDFITRHAMKNVSRQPLHNVENMGKTVSSAPIKPNEPVKPLKPQNNIVLWLKPLADGKTKKTFLSNTGKALQNTPVRQVFSPRAVNVGSLIYNDDLDDKEDYLEELEFTKPTNMLDNYHLDALDYLVPGLQPLQEESPPNTPSPVLRRHSMEFNCSYRDEFFLDDFSCDAFPEDEDDLPDIY